MAQFDLGEWSLTEGSNTLTIETGNENTGTLKLKDTNLDAGGNDITNAGAVSTDIDTVGISPTNCRN